MKKNLLKILILSFTIFIAVGCSVDRHNPKELAEAYMEAYANKNLQLIRELSNNNTTHFFRQKISDYKYLKFSKYADNENDFKYLYRLRCIAKDGTKYYMKFSIITEQNPENDEWFVSELGYR